MGGAKYEDNLDFPGSLDEIRSQDKITRQEGQTPLPRQGPGPQSPPALAGVVHEKNAFPMTQVLTSLLSPSPHPTPRVLSSILSQDLR